MSLRYRPVHGSAAVRENRSHVRREKRSGAIVPNLNGLVFTKEDGTPITKGMINGQVEKAVRKTKVKKFVFHNYRNTALTEWARRGIHVDVAMKAAGHDSVQMHKRYVRLRQEDIASAFGTSLEMATEIVTEEKATSAK